MTAQIVKSKHFCILCATCGHIMPFENLKIMRISEEIAGPCIEITCTVCDSKEYLIGKTEWL